ncbi:MAG: hypothetical protein RLZZ15_2668 [Verrucomicrobiota bacterium]|jgi:hypothetical protein
MRWFFSLSASTSTFDSYARMVQVAVASAAQRTSLVPHFLFDGGPCPLTAWLEARGVRVIYCRSRFYPALDALARQLGKPEHLTIGSGAFLRLEIPTLMRLFGWEDEFVAYTDCDIMFAGDPVPALLAARPETFAVSVESDENAWGAYSTGVMSINPRGLGEKLPAIEIAAAQHLLAAVQGGYDQQLLYHVFPVAPTRLARELNWKSYWGMPPANASIIHFHGPKPLHRAVLSDPGFPALLRPFANDSYLACCAKWDEVAAGL